MSDDLIEMNHAMILQQLAELDRRLSKLGKDMSGSIMNDVLKEAAAQLSAEQKRILLTAPSAGIRSFASDLSVWKDDSHPAQGKVTYRAGYSADKIRQSIKYLVIEYGRPGKRGKEKDKKGRRIGRIQPFSHIRAAWFLKRNAINSFLVRRIDEEITGRWNGR